MLGINDCLVPGRAASKILYYYTEMYLVLVHTKSPTASFVHALFISDNKNSKCNSCFAAIIFTLDETFYDMNCNSVFEKLIAS